MSLLLSLFPCLLASSSPIFSLPPCASISTPHSPSPNSLLPSLIPRRFSFLSLTLSLCLNLSSSVPAQRAKDSNQKNGMTPYQYQSDKERETVYRHKRASGATKRITEMLREIRLNSESLNQATQIKLDLISEEMMKMEGLARTPSGCSELSSCKSPRTTDNTGLEQSSESEPNSSEKGKISFSENVPFYARMSTTRSFRKHFPRNDKSHLSYNRKLSEEGRTHGHVHGNGQLPVTILGLLNAKSNDASVTPFM